MRLAGQDAREMAHEQRLLREVVGLARRCEGRPPSGTLDAVLAGTSGVRPSLPRQRAGRSG